MTLPLKLGVLSVVQNVESEHGIRAMTKRKFLYGDIAYIATDAANTTVPPSTELWQALNFACCNPLGIHL